MQKILGSVALAGALFVANANAADVKPFVGFEVGKTSVGVKESWDVAGYGTGSETHTAGGVFIGFKGGAILDDMHRLSLHLAKHGYSDADATSFTAGYDYLHRLNDRAKLFAGVHLGSLTVDLDDIDLSPSGAVYGFQFGYIHEIGSNFDFEAGLRYSIISAEDSIDYGSDYVKIEVENQLMIAVGFNYKF